MCRSVVGIMGRSGCDTQPIILDQLSEIMVVLQMVLDIMLEELFAKLRSDRGGVTGTSPISVEDAIKDLE